MKAFYSTCLCALVVAATSSACSRDSVPTMEDQLVGRWEWVQSANLAGSGAATPATTGHSVVVEFDRRGRARFYQDGAMIGAAKFRLKAVGGWRKSKNLIIYRGYKSQQFYSVSGNKLILQDTENGKGGNVYYKGKHTSHFAEFAGKR